MSIQPTVQPGSSFDRFLNAVADTGLNYKVSRAGTHIQAECPTHTDNSPSLSVDYLAHEYRTEFHCQADCDREGVIAALGLTRPMMYDDYEEPDVFAARRAAEREQERKSGKRTPRKPTRPRQMKPARPALPKGKLPPRLTRVKPRPLGKWEFAAAHEYSDLSGVGIHQEVREQRLVEILDRETGETRQKTEKRFVQRWPDGKGGWLDLTPEGFEPVLYGLPDLAGWIAEGRRIWLGEGVKDVERFLDLGEASTTNPCGAGNFKRHMAPSLAGAHVVAVLDHDLAGYRRGVKLHEYLTGVVESLRLVLPVTSGRHEDASDHLDAGHGLDDFVDVSLEEIRILVQVADAEEAAELGGEASAEACERARRADDAKDEATRTDEASMAARWAAEAGKQLVRSVTALETAIQIGPVSPAYIERLHAAVVACQEAARGAHTAADVEIAEDLADYLSAPGEAAAVAAGFTEGHTVAGDLEQLEERNEPRDNVIDHPAMADMPSPAGPVPMSRGVWAYELGGERRRGRGVYMLDNSRWQKVAPLPYLHARIVSRDGYGRPMGTYYLVSAERDSVKITIGHDELTKHTWPNILGLAISQDDKILKAATTALIFAAEQETEVVEATPRVTPEGTIAMPVPETLPHGYLQTAPIARDQALMVWGDLVRQASKSARMSLVLGAAAFSPFLAALGNRQPHIVSLHGDPAQGKSVTMNAAAAIWGFPGTKTEQGVCETWNQSKLAPTSFLGELGVLPAFFDEIGMAGNLTAADWGKRIYDICEGASRGRPAGNGKPGFVRGRSWYGILFSAGNSRLMDGIGAGGMAGTERRVVELAAPFTTSLEHAEAIDALYLRAYGHLGAEILERHSASTVADYLERAHKELAAAGEVDFSSPMAAQVFKHLVSHVAGALMVDDMVGTAGTEESLAAAAVEGAREYLSAWEEPLHDADRILDAIHDSLFQEPACWPTVAQHLENTNPMAFDGTGSDRSAIARHGVALKTKGLVANDESWVGVFSAEWRDLCKELGVDSDVACRELAQRGVLIRQGSSYKPGARNHASVVKVGKKPTRLYKLVYPTVEDPDDQQPAAGSGQPGDGGPTSGQGAERGPADPTTSEETSVEEDALFDAEEAEIAPVTAEVTADPDQVTAEVTAGNMPLTREVTAVTAVTAISSRTPARVRDVSPNPDETTEPSAGPETDPASGAVITRLLDGEPLPSCAVCGVTVGQLVDGIPLHRGTCIDKLDELKAAGDIPAPTDQPAPEAREAEAVAAGGRQDGTSPAPAAKSSSSTSPAAGRSAESRWQYPAVTLDEHRVYLPGGGTAEWPTSYAHLGDLAMLAHRDQLRLGHGGGETLPEAGQIWVTSPAALERLGLPGELELAEDISDMDSEASRKVVADALGELEDLPAITLAREAGWEVGYRERVDAWTFVRHPELLPGGVRLVFMPYSRMLDVPVIAASSSATDLVDNLADSAHAFGVQFSIHPGITAHNLINHTRPPRADAFSQSGTHSSRIALIRGAQAELPPFLRDDRDGRTRTIEEDYSWWRSWDSLYSHERELPYVHAYDRNGSYLAEWQDLELGVEGLRHATGSEAAWNGKELPGYWLIERDWGEWPEPLLPPPTLGAVIEGGPNGRVWVTTPTLVAMKRVGITPTVVESFTWTVTTRYLQPAAKVLIAARAHTNEAVTASAKAMYAVGTGRFAREIGKVLRKKEADGSESYDHLWRPDWRHHIMASARFKILLTLLTARGNGTYPVAAARDTVVFLSEEPDPLKAWPGKSTQLDPIRTGLWKPQGSGLAAEWGPEHLRTRETGYVGYWKDRDAMEALISHEKGADAWGSFEAWTQFLAERGETS